MIQKNRQSPTHVQQDSENLNQRIKDAEKKRVVLDSVTKVDGVAGSNSVGGGADDEKVPPSSSATSGEIANLFPILHMVP